MAKGDYRVDLSSLEQVIKELNGVLKSLSGADSDAKYKTNLPPGALGSDSGGFIFQEAEGLTKAHSVMKTHIEEVVQHLNDVTDKFGKKTSKAHGAYQDQDADVVKSMRG
ncbi:hypothetical protein JGS22_000125 [Streptomyces sp. P38-E01]|uniref:Uncharacterized protein n=1 Tax=Streptomyces tardus TaxID=2780544 RepID=A0A949J9R1_9ACTN|nr:hypothetical protein [Streptomyces tardus]MBU7596078.1 hypothetical protein [Streptomyces tardus]